jgi:hypothetical protein
MRSACLANLFLLYLNIKALLYAHVYYTEDKYHKGTNIKKAHLLVRIHKDMGKTHRVHLLPPAVSRIFTFYCKIERGMFQKLDFDSL